MWAEALKCLKQDIREAAGGTKSVVVRISSKVVDITQKHPQTSQERALAQMDPLVSGMPTSEATSQALEEPEREDL